MDFWDILENKAKNDESSASEMNFWPWMLASLRPKWGATAFSWHMWQGAMPNGPAWELCRSSLLLLLLITFIDSLARTKPNSRRRICTRQMAKLHNLLSLQHKCHMENRQKIVGSNKNGLGKWLLSLGPKQKGNFPLALPHNRNHIHKEARVRTFEIEATMFLVFFNFCNRTCIKTRIENVLMPWTKSAERIMLARV